MVAYSQFVCLVCLITFFTGKSESYKNNPNWTPVCYDHVKPAEPEQCLFTPELVEYWGYPIETHYVQTSDHYTLTLFRIPHGQNNSNVEKKPVVFLQHGLMDSSDVWVVNLYNQSLGFLLADAGYDVWMGNVRGNRYSRMNSKYGPKQKEFWLFSFDEMAAIDLPTMIEYVTAQTKVEKVSYVGHSQGTLMGFIKFSSDPDWAEKHIKDFYALAPIWFMGNCQAPVKDLAYPWLLKLFEEIFYFFHSYEFGSGDPDQQKFASYFCDHHLKWDEKICKNAVYWIEGFSQNTNQSRFTTFLAHTNAGTSVQDMIHFGQIIYTKKVQRFNYGPQYHIEPLSVPTYFFHGGQDEMADPKDVAELAAKIPGVLKQNHFYPEFNHLDFLYSLNILEVYGPILNYLKQSK